MSPYIDDDDFEMYKSFYLVDQSGSGLPYYAGSAYLPRQSGQGIGNFLLKTAGKVLKPVVPLVKPFLIKSAKAAGKKLLNTGVDLVEKLIDGRSFTDIANSQGNAQSAPARAPRAPARAPRKRATRAKPRFVAKKRRRRTIFDRQ